VSPVLCCGVDSFGARYRVDIRDLDRHSDNVTYGRLGHAPNIKGRTDCRAALGREQGAGDGIVDVREAPSLVTRVVEQQFEDVAGAGTLTSSTRSGSLR
jgi:hypothetical protein